MSREKIIGRKFDYDQIQWTGAMILNKDSARTQQRNLAFIKTLLELGTVVKTMDTSYAKNIPIDYAVKGFPVEFLPSWRDYKLGGQSLYVPPTDQKNNLLADIRAYTAYTVWLDRLAECPQPPRNSW